MGLGKRVKARQREKIWTDMGLREQLGGFGVDLHQIGWWAVEMEENIMKDILEADSLGLDGLIGCGGRMK